VAGPRSLGVRVIRDANAATMIAAGLGTIFDGLGQEWPGARHWGLSGVDEHRPNRCDTVGRSLSPE
jgi:hypothetical protein